MAKRKKRFSAGDADEAPEFQVAPMADMLFVLLVFFMSITSTEVLQKVANLELARANEVKERDKTGKDKGEVIINVLWDNNLKTGWIEMAGKKYDHPADLVPVLAKEKETFPNMRVVIRADRATEYRWVSDVMRACSGAQIAQVTFSVLTGGESNGAPAPPVKTSQIPSPTQAGATPVS
jgi:biopolymer transport protein ExbD